MVGGAVEESNLDYTVLGLTKNESKVYTTLIKIGKGTAYQIAQTSRTPYGRIYNVLNSLIEKGLVKLIPEKSKTYIPSSPEYLDELITSREKQLKVARDQIKNIKQIYDLSEESPIVFAQGKNAFHKIATEMKDPDSYEYTIKYNSIYGSEWAAEKRGRLKKGIELKDLVRYDKETKSNVQKWLKIQKDLKVIDNEGVAFSIIDDEQVMIVLVKSNTTVLIKDKPFAKMMKILFTNTYNKATSVHISKEAGKS